MTEYGISDEDGIELVKMARKIVTEHCKSNLKNNYPNFNQRFDFSSGVFVTLNKEGKLRGCIGYPMPIKKLSEGLVDAAISAATNDPRFSPVQEIELEKITFEVTVLSPPKEIKVNDPLDYVSRIKVGRDGLIVENRFATGLLLPQVPIEYGWNEKEFLEFTCQKAGLDKNAWKDKKTKISNFQGIVFAEKSPKGDIERKRI